MNRRVEQLRRVALLAHDEEIISLVLKTVREIEEDIRRIESGEPPEMTIHLEPPQAH